jgi:hypothetical protein
LLLRLWPLAVCFGFTTHPWQEEALWMQEAEPSRGGQAPEENSANQRTVSVCVKTYTLTELHKTLAF